MEDVTRLSRCARCGASLPIEAGGDLCATCAQTIGSAPTILARAATASDETRIIASPGSTSGTDDLTVLSPRATTAAVRRPAAPKLEPGQTFGHYRIERLLGRGGMGNVYEAEHLEHGRRVAIKVLNSALAGDDDRARFLSEGQLAASITHPHTVYIFGSEEIDEAPVIAMELLSGGTLRDLVQTRGPLPPAEAVDVILQVIAGLEAAANTGILHRDVKPANCFVDLQGAVKVGDFGLSITTFSHQQQTGMFLGTPQYAPPEQIRGEALDLRADIYAVGGTLFYLLTGQPPFDDRDLTTLVTRVTTEAPRSAREMRANVPTALAEIVTSCLSKDREKRPATYAALEDLLRPFSSAAPAPAGLLRRFAAGALDQSLFFLAVLPLSMFFVLGGTMGDMRWVLSLVSVPLWIAYFAVLEGFGGASLGKRILGLRVTMPDGQRAGPGRATWRSFVYQWPGIASTIIVYSIGRVRVDEFVTANPAMSVVLALPFWVGLGLLFVTARRRNGYAAVQDLLSGTRVTRAQPRTERASATISADAEAAAASQSPARIGPFEVIGSLGNTNMGELVLGFDPQLKRRVWIHVLPPGTPAIEPALRDIGRLGRLRWLSGRRVAGDAWDAYEAFDGLALAALPHAQPWRVIRRWLLDLAQELDAGLKDGTLGMLSVDRVWVTRDGRAKLLDFRAPGAEFDTATSSAPPMASAQTWLTAVAARGLKGSTTPLPLSARVLLDRLHARAYPTPAALITAIVELHARPDRVQRWRRAASVFLPAATPIIFTVFGIIAAIGMRQIAAATPDTDAATAAIVRLDALSKSTDAATVAERRNLETYIAATFRSTLSNPQVWANPLTARPLLPHRPLVQRVLADHPAVSPAELEAATASLGPFLQAQQKLRERQQDKARIAPQAATAAMSAFGVACAAGFGVLFAGIFRGGLSLRLFGLAVVGADGRHSSRWRAIVRALVAWAPAAVIFWLSFGSTLPFRDWTYAKSHPAAAAALLSAVGLLVVGALFATFRPMRGWQDRIAGTWVVPR